MLVALVMIETGSLEIDAGRMVESSCEVGSGAREVYAAADRLPFPSPRLHNQTVARPISLRGCSGGISL